MYIQRPPVGTEPSSGMVPSQPCTGADGGTQLFVYQTNIPSRHLTPEVEPAIKTSLDKLQALLNRESSATPFMQR